MFSRVLRFVRLPLLLILIWALMRFLLQPVFGVPYAPRGNAMFSIVGVTWICCVIYGAMAARVGRLNWLGTFLIGVVLGLFAQVLIFSATLVSYAANVDTYFVHPDALNAEAGAAVPMATALTGRAVALLTFPIFSGIIATVGRAVFGKLAPRCDEP